MEFLLEHFEQGKVHPDIQLFLAFSVSEELLSNERL
jgi:hypothetical protein